MSGSRPASLALAVLVSAETEQERISMADWQSWNVSGFDRPGAGLCYMVVAHGGPGSVADPPVL